MYDRLKDGFESLKKGEVFCANDEEEIDLKDYPSYTEALYSRIMAPSVSGVYISRWDIKGIAEKAGDSMAIHPRKRMFELLMKYAVSQERMGLVLDAMKENIEGKLEIYRELQNTFPYSHHIFAENIAKAEKTVKYFPHILKEYFRG